MYSVNNEKGGLVTTISASFRNSIHSGLRKSPSPFRGRTSIFLIVGNMFAVLVALIDEIYRLFHLSLPKRDSRPDSYSRWQSVFFQTEKLEVVGEIFEEVCWREGHRSYTAPSYHGNVRGNGAAHCLCLQAEYKLIFLGFLSLVEILVSHPLLKSDWDDGLQTKYQ